MGVYTFYTHNSFEISVVRTRSSSRFSRTEVVIDKYIQKEYLGDSQRETVAASDRYTIKEV